MEDKTIVLPAAYKSIQTASEAIGFSMPSDLQTGSLLRTLIASKPHGNFLELGTGTGLALAWITEAMDNHSTVISIDNSAEYIAIAKKHFDADRRVSILCEDGSLWINANQDKRFDLVFADTWPGKYELIDETLHLLKPGGLYVIDDMLPQPNWPDGHLQKVEQLLCYLDTRTDICLTKMNWSTGIVIATKVG